MRRYPSLGLSLAALAVTAANTASSPIAMSGVARPKPGAHMAVAFLPPSDPTGPGATATAEIRLRPEAAGVAEIEVTLAGTGAVTIEGAATVRLAAPPRGQEIGVPVDYAVHGEGTGEVRASVAAFDSSGQRLSTRLVLVYVLATRNEVLHGNTDPLDLTLASLDRAHASGHLIDADYASAVEAAEGAGAVEDGGSVRGHRHTGVEGRILWTDRNGATHPVRFAPVEILRTLPAAQPPLASTTTDAAGRYSVTLANGAQAGHVFVRVYARGPGFAVRSLAGTVQHITSSGHVVAGDTVLTVNLTANNVASNNTAFSVREALLTDSDYIERVRGHRLPDIDVFFPSFGTFFDASGPEIHVLRLDRFDWDVVMHEFGHYIAHQFQLDQNPGGFHFPGNLSEFFGKDVGVRLAWGEGLATYSGTSIQTVMGTAGLGIPFVGDTRYSDTEDLDLDYDLETQTGGFASFPGFVILSRGEDDEVAVQRMLWDVFDAADDLGDSGVALGDVAILDTLTAARAADLSEAWTALTGGRPVAEAARMGCIASEHRVAPAPTAPADGERATLEPPTFRWQPNGGGRSFRHNAFVVELYDADFVNLLLASPVLATNSFTPSAAEWSQALARAGAAVHWVVEGSQTSAPETGPYLGCARTLVVAGDGPH